MQDVRLDAVYPIISVRKDLDPIAHAEALLEVGIGILQLRAKELERTEFLLLAKKIIALRDATCANTSQKTLVLINDSIDVCLEASADGVHLGQADESPDKARERLGPCAIIGLSTHGVEQAERATSLDIDYVAAGPVFTSPTKSGHAPTLGHEGLLAIRSIVDKPLVAIGGIDSTNAASVFATGTDSVAVISALESAPNIKGVIEELRDARK